MDRIRLIGKGRELHDKAIALFNRMMDESNDPEELANDLIASLLKPRTRHGKTLLAAAQHVIRQWSFTAAPRDYNGSRAFIIYKASRQPKPCAYLETLLADALESRSTPFLAAVIDSIITLDLRNLKCQYEPHHPKSLKSALPGLARTLPQPAIPSAHSYSASKSGATSGKPGSPTSTSTLCSISSTSFQTAIDFPTPVSTECIDRYRRYLGIFQTRLKKGHKTFVKQSIADSLVAVLDDRGNHDTYIAAALDALRS